MIKDDGAASARSASRLHEIANGEIEADEHHERDKPLVALGRTVRNDKHAGYSGRKSAIISPPLLHRKTHCLRAAASLTPHPPLDHCRLACLTCHTEDGSELALGLCICRAAPREGRRGFLLPRRPLKPAGESLRQVSLRTVACWPRKCAADHAHVAGDDAGLSNISAEHRRVADHAFEFAAKFDDVVVKNTAILSQWRPILDQNDVVVFPPAVLVLSHSNAQQQMLVTVTRNLDDLAVEHDGLSLVTLGKPGQFVKTDGDWTLMADRRRRWRRDCSWDRGRF